MDFLDHADLTGRLRGLVIMLDDKITIEQTRYVDESIDASEFGIALQTLAEYLAESATPIPEDLRLDFERLASKMEIRDAVMNVLAGCPVEPE
jgi:hypothetical protein